MKKLIFTLAILSAAYVAPANDLTVAVTNTSSGSSTGAIDLTVSGGVAPFIFNWQGPAGFTANTEDINGLAAGTYTVTVTDKYCGVATLIVQVDVNTLIAEINEITSLTYPNPGSGPITCTVSITLDKATLKIMNASGQTIVEKNNLHGNSFLFDISDQAPGVYLIEINNAGIISRSRFVKN